MFAARDRMLADEDQWDTAAEALPVLRMQRESLTTNLFNLVWMLVSGGGGRKRTA